MAPTSDDVKLEEKKLRMDLLSELKKSTNEPPATAALIYRTKVLTMGLVQQDIDGLQSWVLKKRGQEGIFYIDEEIRKLKTLKDTLLAVDDDSLSEKEIISLVPLSLRPGFPEEFRSESQFGRKNGMRGKPTYFYSRALTEENWPIALMDPQEPVRKSVRKKDSTEQQMQSKRFSVSNTFDRFVSEKDSDAVITQKALNDIVTKEISRDVGVRSWADIAGRSLAKRLIKEAALWPMLRPDIFTGLRSVCRAVSFSGPGIDSKLPLAECVAAYTGSSFFMVSFTSLKTKWARQGKDLLVALFAEANRQQPSVIYVQEAEELIKYDNSDDVFTQAIKSEFRFQLQKINDEEQFL